MKILLDTHIFLWLRVAPEKVSEPVLTAFYNVNNEIFLNIASIWEMQIKQQLGKLDLKVPLSQVGWAKAQRCSSTLILIFQVGSNHKRDDFITVHLPAILGLNFNCEEVWWARAQRCPPY